MATIWIQEILNNSYRQRGIIFLYREIDPCLFSAKVWKGLLWELLSFCCDLAKVWHGIQFSPLFLISLFIPGQYRFCFSLNCIFVIPGWPICSDSIHDFLKLGGIINLPRYVMQPSNTQTLLQAFLSSILAYLISAGVRAFDAYATDLPFCNNTAPSPTWEASTCNTTSLVVLKYLRQTSSLIWFLILWNITSHASDHWNNTSFLNKHLRSVVG